jgi:hypothetical protein
MAIPDAGNSFGSTPEFAQPSGGSRQPAGIFPHECRDNDRLIGKVGGCCINQGDRNLY